MIKLIIFDLDGVLIDTKELHYDSLNAAIKEAVGDLYVISRTEHLSHFDGLKTKEKLDLLTKEKNLPTFSHDIIWNNKQKETIKRLGNIKINFNIKNIVKYLKADGYTIAVCSNSIKPTVDSFLNKLEILDYLDIILSNEDVDQSKPHPEIYWLAMKKAKCFPEESLIVEDSPIGLRAAYSSNANVLRINNSFELSLNVIMKEIRSIEKKKNTSSKWVDQKLNVLVPMAGAGSRFEKNGYDKPKPLIDVLGRPMIDLVVNNINIEANYIFLVQKKHAEKYNIKTILEIISPGCKVVEVDGLTEGAACTALLAKQYINNDCPLFFANSDQYVEWDSNGFMYKMKETEADGGIVVFEDSHPKWSFAKINEATGLVEEVAEKNPISNKATVGYYYWKHGSDFVKYAEHMISKDIRVNGEFYVCPVFNEAILDKKEIRAYDAKKMWGLGTPEDLEYYIKCNI